jgi:phenylalanyl-tRNA synthetase beta chain
VIPVDIQAANGCGRYIGRVIRGIDPNAVTPMWMQERLRRSGIRAIHPVVDVTNYVLLELGHPMHGFDLRSIRERVVVRWANEGEKLTLLDGRTVDLQDDCLLIADAEKPLALAGIMGGEHSGVADDTVDVFLESAWFNPLSIAGRARRFGLHTDASHRYERGVDPALQQKAMERATALLLDIAGGKPGPLMVAEAAEALPARQRIVLTRKRLERVLGVSIEQDTITSILLSLGMELEQREPDTWLVLPPSFRFDIAIEEDLIEEVARLYGYDRIEVGVPEAPLTMVACPESKVKDGEIKRLLVAKGLREVITYSFVDRSKEKRVAPDIEPKSLVNPISSEMSVMRTSLWQGLLQVAGYNLRHQVPRVRIFEKGLVFVPGERGLEQPCK